MHDKEQSNGYWTRHFSGQWLVSSWIWELPKHKYSRFAHILSKLLAEQGGKSLLVCTNAESEIDIISQCLWRIRYQHFPTVWLSPTGMPFKLCGIVQGKWHGDFQSHFSHRQKERLKKQRNAMAYPSSVTSSLRYRVWQETRYWVYWVHSKIFIHSVPWTLKNGLQMPSTSPFHE